MFEKRRIKCQAPICQIIGCFFSIDTLKPIKRYGQDVFGVPALAETRWERSRR